MKIDTKWIILIAIAMISIITCFWTMGFINSSVVLREDSKNSWGNVESSYQRRNDLIGNLVKTVQGAANFEKSTLVDVIEARSKATTIKVDVSTMSSEQLLNFQNTQSAVSSSLSRLLVSVEKYPELQVNKNFLNLQTELSGTENRINIARKRYNESVKYYNIKIKTFPNSVIADVFYFYEMPYYKSQDGSEISPNVNFN